MFYNFNARHKEETQDTACVFGTKPLLSLKTERFGNISAYLVVEELTRSDSIIDKNTKISENGCFVTKDGETINLDKRLNRKFDEKKMQLILIDFDKYNKSYTKKYYPQYKILHDITLKKGREKFIEEIEIFFLKNENNKTAFGIKAPELFEIIIKNIMSLAL